MPPRPLHRWKSFWLGLLVLVFLGWAWGESLREYSAASWGSTSSRWMIMVRHGEGRVDIGAGEHVFTPGSGGGFRVGKQVLARQSPTFGRLGTYQECFGPWFLTIPHWLLILLFLIPWTGWLVWRSRRMKRLASPGTAGLQTGLNGP